MSTEESVGQRPCWTAFMTMDSWLSRTDFVAICVAVTGESSVGYKDKQVSYYSENQQSSS